MYKIRVFLCLAFVVFISINAGHSLAAGNSNFYGTYAFQGTVVGCGPISKTIIIGADEAKKGTDGYVFVPQSGNYTQYTIINGSKTIDITTTIVSATSFTITHYEYENEDLIYSSNFTYSYSSDYTTSSVSGTMIDEDPSLCSGSLTASGARLAGGTQVVYIPNITGSATGAGDGWIDYLQVDNLSTSTVSYTLTLYGEDGSQVYSDELWTWGLAKNAIQIKTLTTAAAAAASGKITYTEPKLNFRLSQHYTPGGGIIQFYLDGTLSSKLGFFFSDFMPTLTIKGLALTNFGTAPAQVTLEAIGNGTVNGSTSVTIDPNEKLIKLFHELFDLDISQVQVIRATTTSPTLAGVVVTSESDLSFVLNTAATPID